MKTYELDGTTVKGALESVAEFFHDEDTDSFSLVLETEQLALIVASNLNEEQNTDAWYVCSWIDGTDRQVCCEYM